MKNPKISIITVTYNCHDVVEKTIRSVIGLTYPYIEYIVIDGGSIDGTVDIIQRYSDHIIYFVSEKDKGIYDAMNKGVAAATGEWVIFMNAGDFFAGRDVLQEMVSCMEPDAVVVHGDCISQCEGYYYVEKPVGEKHAGTRMPVIHQSTLIRADYQKKHPYDTSFRSSGDYNFFYQCHFRDHCKFQYVPVLVSSFDNTEGMSKDNHILSMHENLKIWGKENDIWFRCKLEYNLVKYSIVTWIKNHFMNAEHRMSAGIKRAEKSGWDVKMGIFGENVINGYQK